MSAPGRTSVRPLELLRGGWGLALLTAPGPIADRLSGSRAGAGERAVFRVLGARHLAQAVASGVRPGPAVLAVGAWVDSTHSVTSLLLALVDRRRARVALVDAVIAASWAAASRAQARRLWATAAPRGGNGGAPTGGGAGGWREELAAAVLPHLPGATARPAAHR